MQDYSPVLPVCWYLCLEAVKTGWILFRHKWWECCPRHLNICVMWNVPAFLKGPCSRNIYFFPVLVVKIVLCPIAVMGIFVSVRAILQEKLPFSVKAFCKLAFCKSNVFWSLGTFRFSFFLRLVGNKGASHRQTVDLLYFWFLMNF